MSEEVIKIGTKEEAAWQQHLEQAEQSILTNIINLEMAKNIKELCKFKLNEIELAKQA